VAQFGAEYAVIFESYFADCLKDNKKVDLFLNEFSQNIRFNIYRVIRGLRSDDNINNVIGISWKEAKKSVAITVDDVWREEEVEALNSNSELKVKVAAALKKIYRYEGEFYFDDSVPF
jgi:ribosomal 30S subunit maturation factor RimM